MDSDIEISRGFGRVQMVRGRTCMFEFFPLMDDGLIVSAKCLRRGKAVGEGHGFLIHEAIEGRDSFAFWPPHLFRFVRKHIAEAMMREGYSAHDAMAVVQCMNDAEADVVKGAKQRRISRRAELRWRESGGPARKG